MAQQADRDPPRPDVLAIEVHHPRIGVTLVIARGGIDAATVPRLERCLHDAVTGTPASPPRVVLDLGGVTSVDPAGVAMLQRVEHQATACGSALELLAPSPALVLLLHTAATADDGCVSG